MPECYIRGSTIKYLRIPDEVIDMVKEEATMKNRTRDNKGGGGRGGMQNQRNRPSTRGKLMITRNLICFITFLGSNQAKFNFSILIMCFKCIFVGNFNGRGGKQGGPGGGGGAGRSGMAKPQLFNKNKPK